MFCENTDASCSLQSITRGMARVANPGLEWSDGRGDAVRLPAADQAGSGEPMRYAGLRTNASITAVRPSCKLRAELIR